MSIKTTTKHTLTVNATDLKKNLCASYMQLLQDELEAKEIDFEYFKWISIVSKMNWIPL